jgi:site-specific recombinase XerD
MRLRQAAGNRHGNALLLLRDDGRPWESQDLRHPFARTVQRAGLDPREITPYTLRHSSIVRMLLRNVPVAVVADHHDTSEREIRTHYGRYISQFTDAMTRGAMLDIETPVTGNVVALR